MGKIGFRHYQEQEDSSKDTENDDKNVGKQRESSGNNMGTFDLEVKAFSEMISSRYDTTGDTEKVVYQTSRDIAYLLRDTFTLSISQITICMMYLGFQSTVINDQVVWMMYDKSNE